MNKNRCFIWLPSSFIRAWDRQFALAELKSFKSNLKPFIYAWPRWKRHPLMVTPGKTSFTTVCMVSSKSTWIVVEFIITLHFAQHSLSKENIFLYPFLNPCMVYSCWKYFRQHLNVPSANTSSASKHKNFKNYNFTHLLRQSPHLY
jgi:hypothetical protein